MPRGGTGGDRRRRSEMTMVVDPVCGMRIDSEDAAATAEYEGRWFYLCSEDCREAFVASPASYAA